MNTMKNAMIAIILTAILAFSPFAGFAQAATTFSGEAVAVKANALGVSVTAADTGPLPSSGGNLSTSAASLNVAGVVSADGLKSTTSGSGSSSQSQSSAANVNLLNGLITADVVNSNSKASCSGSTASTSGNAQIVNLVAAGQTITVAPNLAVSLPGGISLIVDEQTSSSGGNSGSITVNALHVTGPAIDIIVASSHSDITCS